jgi:hypothetical protein
MRGDLLSVETPHAQMKSAHEMLDGMFAHIGTSEGGNERHVDETIAWLIRQSGRKREIESRCRAVRVRFHRGGSQDGFTAGEFDAIAGADPEPGNAHRQKSLAMIVRRESTDP